MALLKSASHFCKPFQAQLVLRIGDPVIVLRPKKCIKNEFVRFGSSFSSASSSIFGWNADFSKIRIVYNAPVTQKQFTKHYSPTPLFKVKRKKDPALDRVIEKDKKLRIVLKIKEILYKQVDRTMSLRSLGLHRKALGLTGNKRAITLLKRFPRIFEIKDEGFGHIWFRFTPLAEELFLREEKLKKEIEARLVDKVRKLLMMSEEKCVKVSNIVHIRKDMGLPDDFRTNLFKRYPEHFEIKDGPNGEVLDLNSWDPNLAISYEEQRLKKEAEAAENLKIRWEKRDKDATLAAMERSPEAMIGASSKIFGKSFEETFDNPGNQNSSKNSKFKNYLEQSEGNFIEEENDHEKNAQNFENKYFNSDFEEYFDENDMEKREEKRTSDERGLHSAEVHLSTMARRSQLVEERGNYTDDAASEEEEEDDDDSYNGGDDFDDAKRYSGSDLENRDGNGGIYETYDHLSGKEKALRAIAMGKSLVGAGMFGFPDDKNRKYRSRRVNFGLPPGMKLSKRELQRIQAFVEMPYISPYSSTLGLNPNSKEAEKRSVAVIHEILFLTLEKRLLIDHLTHFRKEMKLCARIRDLLIRHPHIFYVSLKGHRDSVFLREAYDGSRLKVKDPLVQIKDEIRDLVLFGNDEDLNGEELEDEDDLDNSEDGDADHGDDDEEEGWESGSEISSEELDRGPNRSWNRVTAREPNSETDSETTENRVESKFARDTWFRKSRITERARVAPKTKW